jgi:hypothetical protein
MRSKATLTARQQAEVKTSGFRKTKSTKVDSKAITVFKESTSVDLSVWQPETLVSGDGLQVHKPEIIYS